MQRIAVILLLVVAALGAVLWLTRAGPAAPPEPPPEWIGRLEAGSVRSVRVQDGRGASVEVVRPVDDRVWLLHAEGWPAWIASGDRVRAALRLVQEGAAGAPVASEPAGADAVRVTFQVEGVGSRRVLIEPQGVGALRRMHVPSEAGDGCRDCLVDAGLARVLSIEGVMQWRETAAVWSAVTDPSRVRIDAGGAVLVLSRHGGRWVMQSPVVAEADGEAVAGLTGALSGVEYQRVLPAEERVHAGVDSPAAVVTLETDVRVAEGAEVRRRVLVQELRIGSGSAAAGGSLTALATATWKDPERGESAAAWGPMLVMLKADGLKGVTPRPEPVLSKVSLRTPRADVREVGLDEGASGGAAPRAARVKLKRTLDGWKRETGTGEAGVSEREAAGLGALLTMLCEARASGAMLAGPPGVRAVGTVTILRDGVVQESAEVGVATVPLASGPAEAIVVKVGSVWRVYPAAAHAAAAECLRMMLPTEG